jgi:cytidylate kinase
MFSECRGGSADYNLRVVADGGRSVSDSAPRTAVGTCPHDFDMIVTIDGPAGAGKSTAARALARRLGFRFLNTGAMYRAVAWAAVARGLAWEDSGGLVELARRLEIRLEGDRVLVDGLEVTEAIRTPEITAVTYYPANNPAVREHLVKLQRVAAQTGDVVAEGRDQGTVVFPHAECKVFLTAGPTERARRRLEDLRARGQELSLETILEQQNERDRSDASRSVGPLVKAADAVELSTDGLGETAVVDRLEQIVRDEMRRRGRV